jgi:two-component system chemotaxis response regulator CheY
MISEARYPAMKEHGRVLVVDDEASIRKTLRLCLSPAGYHVIEAGDGQEAITALNSGDNALMVDAIICDIRMPRIDGADAIRYFRTQYPSIPVIVLTGFPDVELAIAMMKVGVMDYLLKPVTKENLLTVLRRAVESHVLFRDQFVA